MSRMPGQAFTMRMYYTQSVDGPAEGGTGITVKFDSTTLESPMMGPDAMKPALDRMRGLTSTIVYDDRMNVVRAQFGGVAGPPSSVPFARTLTGQRQLSVSTGAPLSSTMSGTMRINARGGQLGAAGMTMAMEQRTSLQLTDDK